MSSRKVANSGRPRGRVLVLGEDARAFLTVIRSLGRKGIEVHVAWCPADAIALRSRYIRRIHSLPVYSPDGDSWKRELVALSRREQFDLVIPCNDQTLIPLQLHRDELAGVARFYTLSPPAFEVAFNKVTTNRLARDLGIRLPREAIVESVDEALAAMDSLDGFPLIAKPQASFDATDLHSRNDVKRIHDEATLRTVLGGMLSRGGQVILQELFVGVGAGVELLARDGKILVAFQHQRVHEPPTGGASAYRKSVPLNPQLLEASQKLVAAVKYSGVAMVEFRINPRSGDWILIEINGRFWGSLPLAVASGVDFPWYLYEMLVNDRYDFPKAYRTEIYCRNTTQELKWLAQNARADHSDPTLCTVPWKDVAKEVFNLAGFREHNDTLVSDDPMPGVAEIGTILRLAWSRTWAKLAVASLSVPPVRRMQALRARRLIREARTVLFVCHGNICRSPFAEVYARRMLQEGLSDAESSGLRVLSSGYFPKPGRISPEAAQRAAEEFGVSLGAHRSCVLSARLVEEADVIFVFDRDNHRQVLSRYPRAAGKLVLIGVLLSEGGVLIDDPYGKAGSEFTACYTRIAGAIARIVALRKRLAMPAAAPADAT